MVDFPSLPIALLAPQGALCAMICYNQFTSSFSIPIFQTHTGTRRGPGQLHHPKKNSRSCLSPIARCRQGFWHRAPIYKPQLPKGFHRLSANWGRQAVWSVAVAGWDARRSQLQGSRTRGTGELTCGRHRHHHCHHLRWWEIGELMQSFIIEQNSYFLAIIWSSSWIFRQQLLNLMSMQQCWVNNTKQNNESPKCTNVCQQQRNVQRVTISVINFRAIFAFIFWWIKIQHSAKQYFQTYINSIGMIIIPTTNISNLTNINIYCNIHNIMNKNFNLNSGKWLSPKESLALWRKLMSFPSSATVKFQVRLLL